MSNALQRIDQLPPEKQALLADRLDPASFGQQRLWFLDQLLPNNPAYHIFTAVRMDGRLDADALERAFLRVLERHKALRTSLPMLGGRLVQLVHPVDVFALDRMDLSSLDASRVDAEVGRLAKLAFEKPFDLRAGPLLRVRLLRLADESHVVLMTVHHAVFDGWSRGIFLGELSACYAAELAGGTLDLLALPMQYGDFARWQRQWLTGEVLQRQLDYWRAQLDGAAPSLPLPVDRPRARASIAARGGSLEFALPPPLERDVRALCKRLGITPFMLLLTAFKTLLYRYTGSTDLTVGTPVAGRGRAEFEGLVGFFVNTLVLRTDIDDGHTFSGLLDRVRHTALDAFGHQDIPFEKLVDELQPERDLGVTPLFQVMFSLQAASVEGLEFPGLRLYPVDFASTAAQFDLALSVTDTDRAIVASLEYSCELFDEPTIVRMSRHYQRLLGEVCENPDIGIARIDLLDAEETQRLVHDWSRPAPLAGTTGTEGTRADPSIALHALFERQAARRPDAIAIVFDRGDDSQVLSYAELDREATRVAQALRAAGVGAESRVGLCLERGPSLLAGMLGILKAGGAYVPLDPAYPEERLRFIVEDAGVQVVVTTRAQQSATAVWGLARAVLVDAPDAEVPGPSTGDAPATIAGEQLAYVIYTSGSTGRPKGVGVAHGPASLHVQAWRDALELGPDDRVLQFASVNFDVSVEQIFATLATGACLVMRDADLWDMEAFAQRIDAHGVTVADLPTAYWADLVRTGDGTWPPGLRLVTVGGESMPVDAAVRWQATQAGRIALWNAFGPTETVITCVARAIDDALPLHDRVGGVPIGRPFGERRAYVSDRQLQPVPQGVAGELCIGGFSLARGYLGHPRLTAERFVPDPHATHPGGRMYRTGDLVRWLPDGDLEFLGRADDQVKIRGYRIEPGEVERVLLTHPAVRSAVALVRERDGIRRLVTYATPAGEERPNVAELRGHLKAELPEYMVPAAIVWLDAFPLMPNGKIDKRALPDADGARADDAVVFEQARSDKEELLAQIWRDVLGVGKVGVHDNFFDLGGDSILSIQVVTRAKQAGLRITPRLLFQHQTVASLASASETVSIDAEQELLTGEVPLMPIQHWFFELGLKDPHRWNQALMLRGEGRMDADGLHRLLVALARHHDALRNRFEPHEGGWRQMTGGDPEAAVMFVRETYNVSSPAEERKAIERFAGALHDRLHLERGPLLAAAYIELDDGREWRLAVAVHHLIVDGVSWRILLDDLQTGYRQLMRGETIDFGPKTTSFRAWTTRLHQRLGNGALEAETALWTDPRHARALPLPLDRDGENLESSVRSVEVALDEAETDRLLHEAPKHHKARIDELLLAALASALVGWTGRDGGVLIDLEGHGRETLFEGVDLSRTVGWFTSQFPVYLEPPSRTSSGAALLRPVKEALRAIPHNGLGYGLLRFLPDSPLNATLRAIPAAQVAFNYLGQLDRVIGQEDALFAVAPESTGWLRGRDELRSHPLEIVGSVSGNRLVMRWLYSVHLHDERSVAAAAETFCARLREFADTTRTEDSAAYTPTDFAKARVNQQQLDKLLGKLAKAKPG